MTSKKFALLLFFLGSVYVSTAQTQQDIQRVIGPPPNVAALFKFNDQPISLYTGTTQLEIPVYTLKFGKYEFPIKLMYHSSGFKVTENASWTGLGWALDAGGAVTSSVNGLDDLTFLNTRLTGSTPNQCQLTSIMNGNYDSQPDLFYYSFLGQSGQFYFNDSLKIVQMPYAKVKIESIFTTGTGFSWKITNIDGTVFYFNQLEVDPTTRQTTRGTSGGPAIDGGTGGFNHPTISSQTWHLTKVVAPTGDSVVLTYESYNTACEYFKGESAYYQQAGATLTYVTAEGTVTVPVPASTASYEYQRINGYRLKTVTGRNGSVQFITGGNRCDLLGDRYLSEIDVSDNTGKLVKKLTFNYNYLTGSTLSPLSSVNCSTESPFSIGTVDVTMPSLQRRLMLTEVDNVNVSTNAVDNKYSMAYTTNYGLPSKFSAQQDTWGYYNGNGQTSLLQNVSQSPLMVDGIINVPVVTGRDANIAYAQQGLLNKITYPTGGSSSFTYELNTIGQFNTQTGCGSTIAIPVATYSISALASTNNTLVGTFTVNHCAGGDSILFEISNCNFVNLAPTSVLPYGFYVKLSGTTVFSSNDVVAHANGNPAAGAKFYLANGTYSIYSFSTSGPNCTFTLTMPARNEPQYVTTPGNPTLPVGGLRIKQIVHKDPVNNSSLIKNFDYSTVVGGVTGSSGVLAFTNTSVLTNSFLTARDAFTSDNVVTAKESLIIPLLTLSSNTNYPLTLTHGSVVGYSQVKETRVDGSGNDQGYTIYNYSTPADYSTQFTSSIMNRHDVDAPFTNDNYPFAPLNSNEWQRGLLLAKTDYKNNGSGSYSVAQSEQNFYSAPKTMDVSHGVVPAFYLNSLMPFTDTCTPAFGNGYNPYSVFKYSAYQIYSQYVTLDSTISKVVDNNSNQLTAAKYYTYDTSNLLPATVKMTNSKNEYVITNTKYPKDYHITGTATNKTAQGILDLQNNNIITVPVETYTQRSTLTGSNLRNISAVFVTYKPSVPLPDTVFNWEPVPGTTSFTPAAINATSVTKDANYAARVSFDKYGTYGNIMQQHKASSPNHSYIWDYNNEYPVAEAINADSTNIAYTSFEADGTGNWSVSSTSRDSSTAITGRKCYSLSSGSITKSGLTSSTVYIVSYWSATGSSYSVAGSIGNKQGKTIDGWTYFEHTVTGVTSVTVSGGGKIDELRLYPTTAQMTTYTYYPITGMSSQCDLNNRITYYDYDGMQRLTAIRDQDKNIIKKICYSYDGSPAPCTNSMFYNSAASHLFTTSCAEGTYPSQVTYTVPANTYSAATQAAADALAQYDITSNGQAYANANGTCIPLVRLGASGNVSGFTATYTNVATGTQSVIDLSSLPLGYFNLLPGTYNVTMSNSANTTTYLFSVCSTGGTSGITSVTFYNIAVSNTSCNAITISPGRNIIH